MSKANIEILPLTRMETRLICGQNEPVQGWVSIEQQDVPAPVAVFKKTAELPIRTGYVSPSGVDAILMLAMLRESRIGARQLEYLHRESNLA